MTRKRSKAELKAIHAKGNKKQPRYEQKTIIPKTTLTKPEIADVKPGMVFRTTDKRYPGVRYARVTKRPKFNKTGDRPDIFYAVLVDPKDFSKKRLSDDREFGVWDFDYDGSETNTWKRVK